MTDIPVQCTRCRNKHMESERISRPRSRRSTSEIQVTDMVCPCCGAKSYYDLRPQIAWCWASGLIEIGDAVPAESSDGGGAIEIARGPKFALGSQLSALARHGQGASNGKLLVPGIPEAGTQKAKGDALSEWLTWCSKRDGKDGVFFSRNTK